MHWIVLGGAFAIFWFLALQIVIPMGARSAHEAGEPIIAGTEPGAPPRPQLGRKVAIATVAACLLWAVLYGLILLKILDL